MTFSVDKLPEGLQLDENSGIISGTAPPAGDYPLTLHANNSDGRSSKTFTVKSGSRLALTPYMGWNDWYAYYEKISDKKVGAAADSMVDNGRRTMVTATCP